MPINNTIPLVHIASIFGTFTMKIRKNAFTASTVFVCPQVKTPDWTCVYEIWHQVSLKFVNTFQSQWKLNKSNCYCIVWRLITWSRMSLLQQPAIGHDADPDETSPHPSILFLSDLFSNITTPCIPSSSEWFLSFRVF